MNDTPPLRGVVCTTCGECRGKGRVRNRTCPTCLGRRVIIYQHGKPVKLADPDLTPREKEAQQSSIRHRRLRENRLADVVCTRCGNPQLESDTLCLDCLETHRAHSKAHWERKNPL